MREGFVKIQTGWRRLACQLSLRSWSDQRHAYRSALVDLLNRLRNRLNGDLTGRISSRYDFRAEYV
jgi:hypothetical protein